MITTLIDKEDVFELVRDKIAQILADESVSQQALAVDAGKDPTLWDLSVFTERSTPWDNAAPGKLIINVWFDTATPDEKSSNTVESQTMRGTFNIDVIGTGVSTPNGAGHNPGDKTAALEASRGLRLVRNILMASTYTYLDMRPIVASRMPQSIAQFPVRIDNKAVDHVSGARLALDVRYEEFSPQYEPATIEELRTEIQRAEDGSVLAQIDYIF